MVRLRGEEERHIRAAARTLAEPIRTVSAGGKHDALLMRNNTGGAEMVTPVGEPARTMAAHADTQSLLVPYRRTGVRPVSTGNKAVTRRLSANSAKFLVQAATERAGIDPLPYSAHSLRAGFVTYAHLRRPATGRSPTRPATAPWQPLASG
jgi:hypothetical protein